jgi:hypothetical protein
MKRALVLALCVTCCTSGPPQPRDVLQQALSEGQTGAQACVQWGVMLREADSLPDLAPHSVFIRETLASPEPARQRTMLWLLRRYAEQWLKRDDPPDIGWLMRLSPAVHRAAVPRFPTPYTVTDPSLIPIALALLKAGHSPLSPVIRAGLAEADRLDQDLPAHWRTPLKQLPPAAPTPPR